MAVKISKNFSRRKLFQWVALMITATPFASKASSSSDIFLNKLMMKSGFVDRTTAVLYDIESKKMIEGYNQELKLPLASVAKAVTAVYGMEAIGQNHKFTTELFTDGYIKNDTLEGNIYLVGGGDPSLTSDDLNKFVKELKLKGIKGISGTFFYDDSALPEFLSIDPSQLPEESFNPGLSGLNLNGNKVLFSWKKNSGGYKLSLEARALNSKAFVDCITIVGKTQAKVVFAYILEKKQRLEKWYVLRKALGKKGVRWLPVRLSSMYTSTVLKNLLLQNDILVGAPKPLRKPRGNLVLLFRHKSKNLVHLSKEMLDRSTNVTAEIIGLYAANLWGLQTPKIKSSGTIMTNWFNFVTETDGSIFSNHSGLSADSRVSSSNFVKFLTRPETREVLPSILKPRKIYGSERQNISEAGIAIIAKTGTMHFNRGLAGYITKDGAPCAVFAIFSADIEKKNSIKKHQLSNPPGSKNWLSRAKHLENTILSAWAQHYI